MNKMNRTSIEWALNPDGTPGYTFNPITGCLNGCEYCYAKKLADTRLRHVYTADKNSDRFITVEPHSPLNMPEPFVPRFWLDKLEQGSEFLFSSQHRRYDKPVGVFVCSMSDLFGIGIPEDWTNQVLQVIKDASAHSSHRFYLLTKQPQNLIKWSPFPDNVWVGVSTTRWLQFSDAIGLLANAKASVKFLSFEPLLERIEFDMLQKMLFPCIIDWLIIGACTGTKKDMEALIQRYPELTLMPWKGHEYTAQPRIEWVKEIVEAADKAGIPVFLKDNLKPLMKYPVPKDELCIYKFEKGIFNLRQEFPK